MFNLVIVFGWPKYKNRLFHHYFDSKVLNKYIG